MNAWSHASWPTALFEPQHASYRAKYRLIQRPGAKAKHSASALTVPPLRYVVFGCPDAVPHHEGPKMLSLRRYGWGCAWLEGRWRTLFACSAAICPFEAREGPTCTIHCSKRSLASSGASHRACFSVPFTCLCSPGSLAGTWSGCTTRVSSGKGSRAGPAIPRRTSFVDRVGASGMLLCVKLPENSPFAPVHPEVRLDQPLNRVKGQTASGR